MDSVLQLSIFHITNSFPQGLVNDSWGCSGSDSEIIPLHYTIHCYLMFNLRMNFLNEKNLTRKAGKTAHPKSLNGSLAFLTLNIYIFFNYLVVCFLRRQTRR